MRPTSRARCSGRSSRVTSHSCCCWSQLLPRRRPVGCSRVSWSHCASRCRRRWGSSRWPRAAWQLLVVSARSLWLKQVGGVVVLALIGSSWWWLPRVWWSSRYGLALSGSETRVDLSPGLLSLWEVVLDSCSPLMAVGAVHAILAWSNLTPAQRFRLWWAAAMVPVLALGRRRCGGSPQHAPCSRPCRPSRSRLLAVDGLVAIADLARRPRWAGPAVAVALAATVIAAATPVLQDTRDRALPQWTKARYGALRYSPSSMGPGVDPSCRETGRRLLAAPSDAAMAWFRHGSAGALRPAARLPQARVRRGAGRRDGATEARREAVTSAFMRGTQGAVPSWREARGAESLLLRSRRGELGVVDFSAGTAADAGTDGTPSENGRPQRRRARDRAPGREGRSRSRTGCRRPGGLRLAGGRWPGADLQLGADRERARPDPSGEGRGGSARRLQASEDAHQVLLPCQRDQPPPAAAARRGIRAVGRGQRARFRGLARPALWRARLNMLLAMFRPICSHWLRLSKESCSLHSPWESLDGLSRPISGAGPAGPGADPWYRRTGRGSRRRCVVEGDDPVATTSGGVSNPTFYYGGATRLRVGEDLSALGRPSIVVTTTKGPSGDGR